MLMNGTTIDTLVNESKWQVSEFITELRKLLTKDETDDNCFRFIQNGDSTVEIEKAKGNFKQPAGSVTLLALDQTINKWYEVGETYEVRHGQLDPATEIEISIGFEKEKTVFENGFIELTNKASGNRLVLHICTDGPSYYKAYSVKGTGEATQFVKRVHRNEKSNNLYHKKTFSLEYVSYVGLVPKFIKESELDNEDVIISEDIANEIQQNVIDVFERAQDYRDAKIPTKRGVLMEGPPGNGKSTLIGYINSRLKNQVTFIYVSDGIIQSADQIATVFEYAREYKPSIVVFEDIDTIGGSRDNGRNNFTSELLTQLDGLEKLEDFVVIATTNFAELIDNALKNRPARFDRRIKIDLPSAKLREEMFKKFLRQRDVNMTQEQIEHISSNAVTKGFSGAHLQEAVITAKMFALHRNEVIDIKHVEEAVKFIKFQYHDDEKITSKTDKVGFRNV